MPRIPPTLGPPLPSVPPALDPGPEPGEAPARRWRPWLWMAWLLAVPVLASHLLVVALRWVPPPTTAFMLQSPTRPVQYQWVPAQSIAAFARQAVVAAEDQKFHQHNGFDFEAIGKALEHNQRARRKRGASTITQQVAKNLFLWNGRSWLRKGLEVYATLLLEWTWGKDRILEVYLNIAEFGPGTYGVEAAARQFFGKSAARLTPEEAARLAAVLPSPRRWRADRPGPYVQSRTLWILGQMGYRPAPADEPEPEPGPEPDTEEAQPDEPLPEAPFEDPAAPPADPADPADTLPPQDDRLPAADQDAAVDAGEPEPAADTPNP